MRLNGDSALELFPARRAVPARALKPILDSLRAALTDSGFHLPPLPPVRHKTSSHYSGSVPYGGELLPVAATGEVAPGIYVCDSALFNDGPASSPTFTIMANACRIADQSLDG